MPEKFVFDIAGIRVNLDCEGRNWEPQINDDLLKFRSGGGISADLRISARYCPLPAMPEAEPVFDSGSIWQLLREEKGFILSLSSNLTGDEPYGICLVDSEFSRAELYLRPFEDNNRVNPLEYPLDEVLMVHLLSRGKRGVIIHGCGIDVNGRGILCAGVSGAGKSTMAGLWRNEENVTILSDDRVIVREENGKLYMHGTPWHGDANVCTNKKVCLEKIFFLNHAAKNNIRRSGVMPAAAKLMVCCFTTFWDRAGLDFSLSFLAKIAEQIPCFELGFVPDKKVVQMLKENI